MRQFLQTFKGVMALKLVGILTCYFFANNRVMALD